MDKNGRIIVIDGADGTGKATATARVLKLLSERRPFGEDNILTASFPNYDNDAFYGKQVSAYLAGDSADKDQRVPQEIRDDPYLAALPFAADRYQAFTKRMKPQLAQGNWYLLDRYYTSSMAYMAAKLDSETERDQFIEWLELLETGYFGLPKPYLVVILDLPEQIRAERVRVRQGNAPRTDIHEQNLDYMAEVAKEYRRLANKFGWMIVGGVENDRQLTEEENAEKIYQAIVFRQ